MNTSADTKTFRYQLARVSWVAGIIAVGLVAATARSSARVTGELIAFAFICVGILAGIVSLVTIAKFGASGLLWPALAGIAINGLLLAIAIPNFLQAREHTIEQQKRTEMRSESPREQGNRPVAERSNPDDKQTTNWRPYQVADFEIMAPFELTKADAAASLKRVKRLMQLTPEQISAAEENAKRMQAYDGNRGDFAVSLNGRTLLPGENISAESMVSQITGALRKQFPDGFQANSRDVTVAGQQATRLTIQCRIQARSAKVENFIILGKSNLWQIQIFGPADLAQYDEIVEKILGSARFLPTEVKRTP